MAVTNDDLRDFNLFVIVKLEHGEARSLVDLANEWEAARRDGRDAAIEVDNNTLKTLADVFPNVMGHDPFQQALSRRGGVTTTELLNKAAVAAEHAAQG